MCSGQPQPQRGRPCVSCHAFNAKRGPSFQGLDLITSPERLRERWFRDFLIAPQSRLPGVVMPESWPGGVAVDDETLGGDTDAQIGAIWHFLTLGRSAPRARTPAAARAPRRPAGSSAACAGADDSRLRP